MFREINKIVSWLFITSGQVKIVNYFLNGISSMQGKIIYKSFEIWLNLHIEASSLILLFNK